MGDPAKSASTAELTAEIVSAYVSNNKIAPSELGGLITTVAGQLSKVGAEPDQPAEEKPEPAVSIRRSIQPNHLICLVCGKPQKVLKRHLAVQHELTPAPYRERFGLKPDYPMAAPELRATAPRSRSEARPGKAEGAAPGAKVDCADESAQIEPVGNNRGRLVTPCVRPSSSLAQDQAAPAERRRC